MRRDDSSPEAYRAAVTGGQRELLEAVRTLILEVAPGVEETIRHGMLGYPGVASLGAQKHHVSLYVPPSVLDRHRERFARLSCGRSCVRFVRLDQLDPEAVRGVLRDVLAARSGRAGEGHRSPDR